MVEARLALSDMIPLDPHVCNNLCTLGCRSNLSCDDQKMSLTSSSSLSPLDPGPQVRMAPPSVTDTARRFLKVSRCFFKKYFYFLHPLLDWGRETDGALLVAENHLANVRETLLKTGPGAGLVRHFYHHV